MEKYGEVAIVENGKVRLKLKDFGPCGVKLVDAETDEPVEGHFVLEVEVSEVGATYKLFTTRIDKNLKIGVYNNCKYR